MWTINIFTKQGIERVFTNGMINFIYPLSPPMIQKGIPTILKNIFVNILMKSV